MLAVVYFYPRSPCGERRFVLWWVAYTLPFLSTLSLRRATQAGAAHHQREQFLSTLSLRRATIWQSPTCSTPCNFYPRSPCGERPEYQKPLSGAPGISIHALLAESDRPRRRLPASSFPFLSTLSLRRATRCRPRLPIHTQFLSTLSLRRATGRGEVVGLYYRISIHALLAESDVARRTCRCACHIISIHALLAESDSSAGVDSSTPA